MPPPPTKHYSFAFTAASLGVVHCRRLARIFLECGSWPEARAEALRTNAFQQTRKRSLERYELEFRNRLQTLTTDQIELLAEATVPAAQQLALLAAFKRYPFISDFCVHCLKPKLDVFDTAVRPSDIENFIADMEPNHPEIEKITDSTLVKIRQVLIKILVEGGILSAVDSPKIEPAPLLPEVARVIASESPLLLRAFLVDEAEIALFAKP